MKKTLKTLAIIASITALLAITAFAAGFEHCADALNDLGLFRGTQNGYELDREPTRAEAATMLVRLLGAEEEALVLSYTAPYTDVADWAKPYVQYLHNKGLTKGTSETTFGYSDKCTAQQYATFLLRILGYSDDENQDFRYRDAEWDAWEIGIFNKTNYSEQGFCRGNMVAIAYTALALPPKSEECNLLTKLDDEGEIKGADMLISKFNDCRELNEALRDFSEGKRVSATVIIDVFGEDESGYGKTYVKTSYVLERNTDNPDKNKFSADIKERFENKPRGWEHPRIQEKSERVYYKDGYRYIDTDGDRRKYEDSFEDMMSSYYSLYEYEYESISVCDFITAEKEELSGNITAYRVDLDGETLSAKLRDGKLLSMKKESKSDSSSWSISVENIKNDATVIVQYPMNLHTYEGESYDPEGWGDLEKLKGSGQLAIGITMKKPFNYTDEDTGELVGFETEFAVEVCERLGVEPVFFEIDWKYRMIRLWNGEIDCIWNGITISDDIDTIEYSDEYLKNSLVLLVKEESIEKYSDSASGAKIIDSGRRFVDKDINFEYLKSCKILEYGEGFEKDIFSLATNEADMVLADEEEAKEFLKKNETYGIAILPGYEFFSEKYGIAFREESDLIPEINKIIQEMKKDGTLSEIAKKYNLEQMLAK